MITTLSPLFKRALREGRRLYYFADLWKSVLNARVDSEADFDASVADSNMDYASNPGFARLATVSGTYEINQTTHDTYFEASLYRGTYYYGGTIPFQTFRLAPGRRLNSFSIRVDNTAAAGSSKIIIRIVSNLDQTGTKIRGYANSWFTYTQHYYYSQTVDTSFNGDITVSGLDIALADGDYWIMAEVEGVWGVGDYSRITRIRATNTDPYAGGMVQMATRQQSIISGVYGDRWATWASYSGHDLYFTLSFSGYEDNGYFTTKTMDLGSVPQDTGYFQAAYDLPAGTTAAFTLYASTTGAFGGEETTYAGVTDGWVAPAGYQFWRCRADLRGNAAHDETPLIDMLEMYYPDDRVRFRQRNVALRYVAEELKSAFEPMLEPVSETPSELKIIERVSSVGTVSLTLKDATPERLQLLVSDSPLKNCRVAVYLGADMEGFSTVDLFRTFTGIVESADPSPKYRGDTYGLSLTVKNPILELKRKVPLPDHTAILDFETTNITHDLHVMDSMLDLIRGKARTPARYIDVASFNSGKTTAGSGTPAPQSHWVRRSNSSVTYSDGTAAPDTRIKSPEELVKLLTPLAVIADGYIVPDETSRIKYIHHDATADPEEVWADESLVRSGALPNAIPIYGMKDIQLGYADMIFNMCFCGCEWDGEGDSWGDSFKKVFGDYNSTSGDAWAPGGDTYIQVMEANMKEVSKWLGPETTYNGESLAQAIAARMTGRFGYPPARLVGVEVPLSQFERGVGAVVQVYSDEFYKFRRRKIALSETVRFMVIKQQYDQNKNIVLADLLELT